MAGPDGVNRLGIYVLRGEELVLGPFQGKPTCLFSEADQSGIEKICEVFCAVLSGKDFI
jgi:putative methionine-R-sulfoxide reductase with GAF domain